MSGTGERAAPHTRTLRYSVLFVALVLLILLPPSLFDSTVALAVESVLSVVVVLGALASSRGPRRRGFVEAALGVPFVATTILETFRPGSVSPLVGGIALLVFAAYVARTLIVDLVTRDEVPADAIFASFCAYLLIAVAWSGAYVALEAVSPASFRMPDGTPGLDPRSAMYFSLVTLTTLGYGDIVPVTTLARRLAVLEAVGGVLFIAVVVSRLVAAYRGPVKSPD